MMLDQGPLLEGKQAIQGLLEAMINAKLLTMTRTIIEARTSGDLGFVAGTSTFSMGGGPSIAAKGHLRLEACERTVEDRLRHFESNHRTAEAVTQRRRRQGKIPTEPCQYRAEGVCARSS